MEGKTKRASGRGLYAEGDKNPHEHEGTVLETKNPLGTKKLYIESYGCQMNFSDSEISVSSWQRRIQHHTESGRGRFGAAEYLFYKRQGRTDS